MTNQRRLRALALGAGWALAVCGVIPTPVAAQDKVPPAIQGDIYLPADFSQFQPNTALDMVTRVPGFRIQGGEGGDRGFGQASLNIIINGRRPSSKSSDATEILSRIPADNVTRIEIVDGTTLDIPGLTGQVANIITQSGKLSGNWRYAARFVKNTEPQVREGEVSITATRGNWAIVANLGAEQFTFDERGPERFFDANGVLTEDRQEQPYYAIDVPNAALNLTWTGASAQVANLNLSARKPNRRSGNRETYKARTEAGRTGREIFGSHEDEFTYEVSGDYARPVGDGTLKLIGLHRYEDSDFNNTFEEFTQGRPDFASVFNLRQIEKETIARGEYSWQPAAKHDLQFALEGAINRLDSESDFIRTGLDNPAFDAVEVKENRAETTLTHSWSATPQLSFQSSLGAEFSQISVVSSQDPAREFVRPKGFVSASYQQSPRYTWRARAERRVGQLDFGAFVSRAALGDGVDTSGNTQIVPAQFWDFEVELERVDEKVFSGTITAYLNLIEDPITQILFADGSEGPGNLDSAKEYGIEGNLTWLLDDFGVAGGRIEASGGLEDSDIFDPITQTDLRLNGTDLWEYNISYRHDIPQTPYAYFAYIQDERDSPTLRIVQDFKTKLTKPTVGLGLEHKELFGMRWELRVDNLLNWRVDRRRRIFDGTRAGALVQTQLFSRQRGPRVSLEISDTF